MLVRVPVALLWGSQCLNGSCLTDLHEGSQVHDKSCPQDHLLRGPGTPSLKATSSLHGWQEARDPKVLPSSIHSFW